jgi:hypothetical protein
VQKQSFVRKNQSHFCGVVIFWPAMNLPVGTVRNPEVPTPLVRFSVMNVFVCVFWMLFVVFVCSCRSCLSVHVSWNIFFFGLKYAGTNVLILVPLLNYVSPLIPNGS